MTPERPPGSIIRHPFDYDGGREISVYLPVVPPTAIVYATDGQLVAPWGADLGSSPPTMVVGVHRTDDPDELVRIGEYSPTIEPKRFAAHERFVLDDVRPWVEDRFDVRLPADRTAVFGVSAGAEFALAMGLRHPEVFGAILAASPGAGFTPPDPWPDRVPPAYLVAGTSEPFFAENTDRWADALRAHGVEVLRTERKGGHGDPFWRTEFAAMVAWAFRDRGGPGVQSSAAR